MLTWFTLKTLCANLLNYMLSLFHSNVRTRCRHTWHMPVFFFLQKIKLSVLMSVISLLAKKTKNIQLQILRIKWSRCRYVVKVKFFSAMLKVRDDSR